MNPNYLDFEQPIAELQAKIEELRLVGNDSQVNLSDEIGRLEEKSRKLTESIFKDLTPGRYPSCLGIPSAPTPWITWPMSSPISMSFTGIAISPTTLPSSVALPVSMTGR